MTFEEPEARELWGYTFRATDAAFNAMKLAFNEDPRTIAWRVVTLRVMHGQFDACTNVGEALCVLLARHDAEVERLVWNLIQKHTKEDR